MEKDTKKTPKVFSFSPEVHGVSREGRTTVLESNPYKMYDALGVGTIYYTTNDAKFWIGEGAECPEDMFTKQFLPYLRWKFDQFVEQEKFVEVEVEVEDAKGNKKFEKQRKLVGKETVNKFPCTPKNILKKRQELIIAATSEGDLLDIQAIRKETSPTQLISSDEVLAATKPQGFTLSPYKAVKNLLRS